MCKEQLNWIEKDENKQYVHELSMDFCIDKEGFKCAYNIEEFDSDNKLIVDNVFRKPILTIREILLALEEPDSLSFIITFGSTDKAIASINIADYQYDTKRLIELLGDYILDFSKGDCFYASDADYDVYFYDPNEEFIEELRDRIKSFDPDAIYYEKPTK